MNWSKYLLVIFILSWEMVNAQNQANDLQFLPINADISQNTITTILQDSKGYLWIGTRNGLNKYDGVNIITYLHNQQDSSSISNSYIKILYENSYGELWVGTDGGGISIYNESNDSFKRIIADGSPNSISGNSINTIYEDRYKNLWVGTQNNGLNLYDRKNESFIKYKKNSDDPFSISSNNITGITEDKDGNLWFATWGGGMNLFNLNTKRFIKYLHNSSNHQSINSDVIRHLYKDRKGSVWIGTNDGLNKLTYDQSGRFVFEKIPLISKFERDPIILSVLLDTKNRLWVGTENEGINLIDINSGVTTHHTYDPKLEFSIQNNSIWSLFEDNTGIIWIGTFNKGLNKLDENSRKFRSYRHNSFYDNTLSNNSVSSFIEDEKGNVWIGTDGGGLDYWDITNNTFKHYNKQTGQPIKNEVLCLLKDSKENLWVGNWYGGISIKKKGSDVFKEFKINHPNIRESGKENIFSIYEDHKGRIWIAAFRDGIIMYDPNLNHFKAFANVESDSSSISSDFVRITLQDSYKNIWIGTEGGGLNKVVEKDNEITFQRFTNNPDDNTSISSNSVLSLLESDQKGLWVGTAMGLNFFDFKTSTFFKYGKSEGLPDEVIYAIQLDDQQNLWLSSNKGLTRMNTKTKQIRNFDTNDGLQAMEFFKNSSYKLSTGQLLFGGVEGFNIFYPEKISEISYDPKVYLSGFKISNELIVPHPNSPVNRSLNTLDIIKLNHNQNDFSFEFALLSFSQTSRNEYAYQLVNYDAEWQVAGKRREAYYTNVPPGRYTFKVKGTNNEGVWSPNEASIDILISPAWYASGLAYLFYLIIFLGLLSWGFRTVVNRERLQAQLKVDHLELTKMQELDEMKSSFFANISHEFRSPLTLILGPLKGMLESGKYESSKDQVTMMIRNSESLLNLINQLLELSKLESGKMRLEATEQDIALFLKPIVHSFSSMANRNYVNYKIEFPKYPVPVYFDNEKMEKIMVNLLSNAFKYTNEFGNIIVKLESQETRVVISVKDDGIGIPKDEINYIFNRYYRVRSLQNKKNKGTGIGLSLAKELVELHQGRIELQSEESKGSIFKVILKKGKDHLTKTEIIESIPAFDYNNTVMSDFNNNEKSITIANQDVTDSQSNHQPLVLIIEDNEDIRNYITSILKVDYNIVVSDNGLDGLQTAFEIIPDLIISDVMMPGIDGFEVCEKVKTDIRTSHIPFILLTAKASNDSALQGFEIGADYYITKPFNPKLLTLRVRNVLNIRNQFREKLLNKSTLNIEPKNVKIASKDEEFINKAVATVEKNMSNSEFYVDDLAKELGLSRMQLYRKLKGLIDQSANEFVRSIRLKRAAQLLVQNQLTVAEITYQVGFNDLQYFRDCFKKQFGENPSEYTLSHKKDN